MTQNSKITFQRNLIGMEDLLFGIGKVLQTRGVTPVNITKINAAEIPFNEVMTIGEKIDQLSNILYVDADGIPTYIATPHSSDSLNLAGVIWMKDISASERHVYYGEELMFKYNRSTGNLILDTSVFSEAVTQITNAYTAADTAVASTAQANLEVATAVREAAETALDFNLRQHVAATVASLNLGTAAIKNVGTSAGNVVQLDSGGKLPAIDGSQLTGLASPTTPAGVIEQSLLSTNSSTTIFYPPILASGVMPSITTGTEIHSVSITPTKIGNKIRVLLNCPLYCDGHRDSMPAAGAAALFINNGASAVKCAVTSAGSNASNTNLRNITMGVCVIDYELTASSLSPISIKVRIGFLGSSAGCVINPNYFGPTGISSTLRVEEIKA